MNFFNYLKAKSTILALALGTIGAFVYAMPEQTTNWFEVDASGNIDSQPMAQPPAGCDEEEQLADYIYCAVAYNASAPPVTHISQLPSNPPVDERFKPDDD